MNVAGGVRVEEPAVDLGIVVAMASSFLEKPVDARTVVLQMDARVKEAQRVWVSTTAYYRKQMRLK
jgi:DNA repair protein RadA/Sms